MSSEIYEGFYFVKFEEDRWEVGEYDNGAWWATGEDESFDEVLEVGARIVLPTVR